MDPSFDDLLDSLDQIQAERGSTGGHHHDHHHHHHDHDHHHSPQQQHKSPVHVEVEYHIEEPYQASRDHATSGPSYNTAVHHPNPASSYPSSRQGDLKQYERQSTVHPSHGGGGGGGAGADTRCHKCGNTLYGTEYVTAGGKSYHQDHFTCDKCQTRLVGAYYDHKSKTYCPTCAGELMPCTKCRRGITGQYLIQDGRPFHNECVDRKHCAKCNRPIEDTVLSALGKSWHTRCFTCITCNKELGTQFISKDGHGQCENCSTKARPHCGKCNTPLSGEYITFEGKSYHQECFVCTQCRDRLGTSGFFNVNGQLKCQRCSNR